MNNNAVKRNKLVIIGILLGIVLLVTVASAVLGYQLGLQTPISELAPEVGVEEVALITAIIYGVKAGFIGIASVIAYLIISFLLESRNEIKSKGIWAILETLKKAILTYSKQLLVALAHLSILIPSAYFVGTGLIVPSIIWLVQKDKSHHIAIQSLQALIFQLIAIVTSLVYFIFLTIDSYSTSIFLFVFGTYSIIKVFFYGYGIFGAIRALQDKPFNYWVIGNQVEQYLPRIIGQKLLMSVLTISIIIISMFILCITL